MMFVSIGIGTVLAVALIVVVSILTGGSVNTNNGQPTSNLVGKTVKGFTVAGLNGGTQSAPWASGHPGVLIFFASYCGPCHKEMPKVATYVRTHDEKPIVVMGIDAVDVRSSAQAFITRSKVTFPIAFDPNGVVTTNIFKFQTVPETVFVSKRGVVEQVYFGAIPVAQLKSGLAALRKA
jgi:thiol-disulfide isomerase/thioredoxin